MQEVQEKKGKLIVLEAGDASGKATQTKLLYARLMREGRRVMRVTFPNYASDSSALVRMYLAGEFGTQPGDVDAYAASTFFAVDRYASYRKNWRAHYLSGGVVLCDRYVTSNMVHQAVKLTEAAERWRYREWLMDLEYEKLGLPRPDEVVFLDMNPLVSERLLAARAKETGERDIHEKDTAYLERCHTMYREVAALYGWKRVVCDEGGAPRAPEAIAEDVYAAVAPLLTDTARETQAPTEERND